MKRLFWEWIYLVVVWTVVASWVSYFDVTSSQFVLGKLDIELESIQDPYLQYLVGGPIFFESVLFGLVYGSTFFLINRVTDVPYFNKRSSAFIIATRSLLYTIGLGMESWVSAILLEVLEIVPPGYFGWSLGHGFDWPYFISIGSLVLVVIILLNISFQVARKYGQSNVLPIFWGKYRQPRMESRIFLFIDLKSSTTYAEQLGHHKFSRLIQIIFSEINRITPDFHGQIYNYVGDEVIITWPEELGLKKGNCIGLLFKFIEAIHSRESYFQNEFGLIPNFKAGLHGGDVTVAEVGIIKRDISFFGDVVNTASRLQSLCSEYDEDFLTSKYTEDHLSNVPGIAFETKGKATLKGKEELIEVFAVRKIR